MGSEIRLLLVDDHYLVRLGLSSVIALEADMRVCAEAATGHHAIELFRSERPDVTLMDLRLPDLSGTDAIRTIRAEFPQARIIALSTFAGDEEIHMALAGRRAGLPGEDGPAGGARRHDPESGRGSAPCAAGSGGAARRPLAALASVARASSRSSSS